MVQGLARFSDIGFRVSEFRILDFRALQALGALGFVEGGFF